VTELTTATACRWLAGLNPEGLAGLNPEGLAGLNPGGLAGSRFEELGGGVSSKVILVETPDSRSILKQSLEKLRVEREWLSDRNRILREAAAMRWVQDRIRGGRVPRILLEDSENFVIGMEAAPPGAEMWKTQLFRGVFDTRYAQATGTMLGSFISAGWNHPEARRLFGDQSVFHQLRIEPYYLFTAQTFPEFAPYLNALVERTAARTVSLVHGDWSPKNLLVTAGEVWAIDWEVVHFGDPSFDAAFLLNHLLLKSIAMSRHRASLLQLAEIFLAALTRALPPDALWIPEAALEHLPALLLARVEGKSPAEYLDDEMRGRARTLAHRLLHHPPATLREAFDQ
jgi:hypothetical protein